METSSTLKLFKVFIDDNFHYMDESERYEHGAYETYEEAVTACKLLLDDVLSDTREEGKSAEDLINSYMMFGEDPFVAPVPDDTKTFSAWEYVKQHYEKLYS